MIMDEKKIQELWLKHSMKDIHGDQNLMHAHGFKVAVEDAERYLCTQLTRIVRAKNRKEKRATSRKR